MFNYFMVQIPPNVNVQAGSNKNAAAATYLGQVVNHYAQEGWEFYSIETIGLIEHMGCGCLALLLSLFAGYRPSHSETYVIVFRRPKASG
jgi:hypothetical protein